MWKACLYLGAACAVATNNTNVKEYTTQSPSRLIWGYSQWTHADSSTYHIRQHIRDLAEAGVTEVLLGRVTFTESGDAEWGSALKKWIDMNDCERKLTKSYLKKKYSRVWAIVGGNGWIDNMLSTDLYGTMVPKVCKYAREIGIDGVLFDAYDENNNPLIPTWLAQAVVACTSNVDYIASTFDYKVLKENPWLPGSATWETKWIPQYFRSEQGYSDFNSIFMEDPFNSIAIFQIEDYSTGHLVFSELAWPRSSQTYWANFPRKADPVKLAPEMMIGELGYNYDGGLFLYEIPEPEESMYHDFVNKTLPLYASWQVRGGRPEFPHTATTYAALRMVPRSAEHTDQDFINDCKQCVGNACYGGWQSYCQEECHAATLPNRPADQACPPDDNLARCVCNLNTNVCRPNLL